VNGKTLPMKRWKVLGRTMNVSAKRLKAALLIMTSAAALVGCGTTAQVDVAALRRVVGTDLLRTKGATDADQDNINRTVIRLGRAKIYTQQELESHGQAVQGGW
jgi:hypothetical protein